MVEKEGKKDLTMVNTYKAIKRGINKKENSIHSMHAPHQLPSIDQIQNQ